jgi:hypothetical protein
LPFKMHWTCYKDTHIYIYMYRQINYIHFSLAKPKTWTRQIHGSKDIFCLWRRTLNYHSWTKPNTHHYLMFCWPCIIIYQYSKTNKMHFLYSVYYELTASTCFEHYLLIFRRCCINNNSFHSNPGSSQPT